MNLITAHETSLHAATRCPNQRCACCLPVRACVCVCVVSCRMRVRACVRVQVTAIDLDDTSMSVDVEEIQFASSGSFRRLHAAKLMDTVKEFYASIPNTRKYFREKFTELLKRVRILVTEDQHHCVFGGRGWVVVVRACTRGLMRDQRNACCCVLLRC